MFSPRSEIYDHKKVSVAEAALSAAHWPTVLFMDWISDGPGGKNVMCNTSFKLLLSVI